MGWTLLKYHALAILVVFVAWRMATGDDALASQLLAGFAIGCLHSRLGE